MNAKIALMGAAVLLGGCNSNSSGSEPDGPARTEDQPANALEAARTGEAGDLPVPGPLPRFVGKWAADQKSCDNAAWQFTSTTMRTPAGSSCTFSQVSEVPGGYDVAATCTAKGPPASDTLKIRFAESAKAMLFGSKAIGDTGLVFCGRDA